MMVIEGNHEMEPQWHGGAVTTFASYSARFAVPANRSVPSTAVCRSPPSSPSNSGRLRAPLTTPRPPTHHW